MGNTGLALDPAAGPVKDIGLGYFKILLEHQLLLHNILNILDIDKCLTRSDRILGYLGRDFHGRFRIQAQG